MGAKPREGGGVERTYAAARRLVGAAPAAPSAPRSAGAVALWRRQGGELEIYLVERSPELAFAGGFWSLPGGAAEPGEAPAAAAVRELAEESGIELDGAELIDLGTWTTPEASSVRFDTRFFAAPVPAGQEPDPCLSGGELVGGAWVRPADALAHLRSGQWLVPPPIARLLELLEGGLEAAAAGAPGAAAALEQAPRRWELAGGVSLVPLRTPTLPPATHTNCYLVGSGELVIIDPATPYPDEQAEIDRVLDAAAAAGQRPVAIWLTHHHLDHVGDAARLAARLEIPIAAHPETAARLAGRVPIDRHLEDGDRVELAGDPPRSLRAVFTPGHAPGHLCFLEEHTGFLAAGDMVAGIGSILVDPDGGDMGAYLASLERIRDLEPRRLLPAHGPVIPRPAVKLAEYRAHRLWREAQVLAALGGEAQTPADLLPKAYADVAPVLYPLARRSLLAHLDKLERDGLAGQSGAGWRRVGS